MFSVTVKPGHPTGVRHRAGLAFSASGPTLLETVPDAVVKDTWLIVSVAPADPKSIPSPSTGEGEGEGDNTPRADVTREKGKGRRGSGD